MGVEKGGPGKGRETAERPVKKIRKASELAGALGYERNVGESTGLEKEFVKPFKSAWMYIVFQTGYLDPTGERVTIGVKRTREWDKYRQEKNVCQDKEFEEWLKAAGIQMNSSSFFLKSELKDGGYDKLFVLLQDLEESDFYSGLFDKLMALTSQG